MSGVRTKALPGEHVHITTDSITEVFWSAAKERRLVVPQCGSCGRFRMPPTPFCPHCQSERLRWPEVSGRGKLFSFAIVDRSPFPDVDDFTYVGAIVDLPDAPGARLATTIVDADPGDIEIGMALQVDYSPIADGWLLPVFRVS